MTEDAPVELQGASSPPASGTLPELLSWAEAHYPWIEWDVTAADARVFAPILAQLACLSTLYPDAFAMLDRVGLEDFSKTNTVYGDLKAIGLYQNQDISFNVASCESKEQLQQMIEEHPASEYIGRLSIEALVTHEFGHLLHDWLLEGQFMDFSTSTRQRSDGSFIWSIMHSDVGRDNQFKRALTPYTDEYLGTVAGTFSLWLNAHHQPVSEYAKQGDLRYPGDYSDDNSTVFCHREGFAEAFAALHHTPPSEQPEFVKQLGRVLDRVCAPDDWYPQAQDVSTLSPDEAERAYEKYLVPLMEEFDLSPESIERVTSEAREDEIDFLRQDLPFLEEETKRFPDDKTYYLSRQGKKRYLKTLKRWGTDDTKRRVQRAPLLAMSSRIWGAAREDTYSSPDAEAPDLDTRPSLAEMETSDAPVTPTPAPNELRI